MEISQVPPGYVFRPSDEELVQKFLLPKKNNEPLPCPCIVREFDQFGSTHPYKIWDMYNGSPDGKTDLYFFVKSSNSRTIQADGSRGTWKNEGNSKICNMDNQTIGIKRRFSYKNPGLPAENCRWIMYEYSLEVKDSVSSYVIRRLRKKAEKKNEIQHSAVVQLLLPPNSQHEEDVENHGSTGHRQDHSLFSDLFSSPLRGDFIPMSESFAANPSAFPEPQSPFLLNMN